MNENPLLRKHSQKNIHDRDLLRPVLILIAVVFSIYGAYLFYLQAFKGREYRNKASTISRALSIIPAQRGLIMYRDAKSVIADSIPSYALYLSPAEVPADQRDLMMNRVSQVLGINKKNLEALIPASAEKTFQNIEIASGISLQQIMSFAERKEDFPGISWQSKPIRNYIDPGSMSHIVGYVGDITKEEIKLNFNQGYKSGDSIGKAGIEREYDLELRGKHGTEYKTVDVKGKHVDVDLQNIVPPVHGNNIVLTIDQRIQKLAEDALGKRTGSAIVLKPKTGEILAMVSYPWYDPGIFARMDSSAKYSELLNDPNKPLLDRAFQSSYPPASTFKTILTAGIIEDQIFPLDRKILCPGEIVYGDRTFRCWTKKPGHGWLDLRGALENSCDIYFWTLGRDFLGIDRLLTYATEFGFGKQTGIDLPGEDEGFVPTPQWKERKYFEKWMGGDTMNLSIGQGDLATSPLQIADMMAMVVNDGIAYRPHIAKEIRDPATNAILKEITPVIQNESHISKSTFVLLRNYLRSVVANGTAKFPVSTKVVSVAGKTGTAEVGIKDHWHSWFAAFGPYDAQDPDSQVVVVVMVEASNPWEWWAPYASNIIFQGIFAHQTYEQATMALGLRTVEQRRGRVE